MHILFFIKKNISKFEGDCDLFTFLKKIFEDGHYHNS